MPITPNQCLQAQERQFQERVERECPLIDSGLLLGLRSFPLRSSSRLIDELIRLYTASGWKVRYAGARLIFEEAKN